MLLHKITTDCVNSTKRQGVVRHENPAVKKVTAVRASARGQLMISALLVAVSSVAGMFSFSATEAAQPPAGQREAVVGKLAEKAINHAKQQQASLLSEINEDALAGFKKIRKASLILEEAAHPDEDAKAIKLIEQALQHFDKAVKNTVKSTGESGLAAIDSSIDINELVTPPENVKSTVEDAIRLLKKRQIQEARELLEPLQDDMMTEVVFLPMNSYPDAVRDALKSLRAGDREEAFNILDVALESLLVEESVLPLAIIRSESYIKQAAEMDRVKQKEAMGYALDAAAEQLDVAYQLGYVGKHSLAYEQLQEQIATLRKGLDGEQKLQRMFDSIRESFESLQDKISGEKEIIPAPEAAPELPVNGTKSI